METHFFCEFPFEEAESWWSFKHSDGVWMAQLASRTRRECLPGSGTEWTAVTIKHVLGIWIALVTLGLLAHVPLISVSAWELLRPPSETRKLGSGYIQSFAAAEQKIITNVCWFKLFFSHCPQSPLYTEGDTCRILRNTQRSRCLMPAD